MVVCEYCHSTLLKDAESVKNIGKMSDVMEDYSPIQIQTSGQFRGRAFTVVGRIQLRYGAGFWNEWYLSFDSGTAGWLSDASGQYIITEAAQAPSATPEFAQLRPGRTLHYRGVPFTASDVRTARCVAGQGELPFVVAGGWEVKVADFRADDRFLTLDYSEDGAPKCYSGQAIQLEQLRCQLLRSVEQITETTGRFRGKTQALACPSCGSAIQYQVAMALYVVCPSCHAEVDCSGDTGVVLNKIAEVSKVQPTLALGDVGTFNNIKYTVIGFLERQEMDSEEASAWTEYLLFNAQTGFLWLVESEDGWDRVSVLNAWPQVRGDKLLFADQTYRKKYAYTAVVTYAAGAFNWRVSVGDANYIDDYEGGFFKLTAESSAAEITWSKSRRIDADVVGQAFGKSIGGASSPVSPLALGDAPRLAAKETEQQLKQTGFLLTLLYLILNIPIMFHHMFTDYSDFEDEIGMMGAALLVLWLPLFGYFKEED